MKRILPLLPLFLALLAGPLVGADDVLRFPNGELIKGRYVATEGGFVVFDSVSLGRLRVAAGAAVLVVTSSDPLVTPQVAGAPAQEKKDSALPSTKQAVPTTLPAASPWKLGFNLSLELRREVTLKSNFYTKAYASRDFARDALKLDASYEHNIENDHVTVDMAKFNGYWRHSLTPKYFTLYSPKVEWNRHYEIATLPLHYLLTQHQVGVGRTLWDHPKYHLRAGVAENYFYVWLKLGPAHASVDATVESVFVENELSLPWDLKITHRCVYYDELRRSGTGWESDLELVKKLNENLRVGLTNEVRRNVPGIQTTKYNLWRLFLGLEY